MTLQIAPSRWPTHAEVNRGKPAPGNDLSQPLEARRCTVQLSSGRLYLDAVASNSTSLLGHDRPPAPDGNSSDVEGLLSALEPGYACVMTAQSFSGAAEMALKLARGVAGENSRIAEAYSSEGEPPGGGDFLVAYENETLGRWGRWCSSVAWERPPELIVIGDAIALGSPFGALLARNDLAAKLVAPVTDEFQDRTADCATLALVAAATLAVDEGGLLPHGRLLANYLYERLLAVQATCPEIKSVKCNGLSFRIAFAPPLTAVQVRRRMCERGVLAGVDASGCLALDPPLPLRIAEADVITGALRSALLGLPLVSASVCCPACERES